MSITTDDNQVFTPETTNIGGDGASDGREFSKPPHINDDKQASQANELTKPGQTVGGDGASQARELSKPGHIVGGDGAALDKPDGTAGTDDVGEDGGAGGQQGGAGDAQGGTGGTGTSVVAGTTGGESDGKGGSTDNQEEPPEGDIEADKPFNPVPLKDLIQAPKKEDLFGKLFDTFQLKSNS